MKMIIQTVIYYTGRVLRIVNTIRIAIITFIATAAVTFVLVTGKFISSTFSSYQKRSNRKKIAKKRAEVEIAKKKLRSDLEDGGVIVTEERNRISSLSINELIREIHDGRITCIQVLRAYQAKALEATDITNCVTEFIAEAEDWAKELDNSQDNLPLRGIPFSVKDVIAVAGYENSIGLAKNLGKREEKDVPLIRALKSLGAIPFCKTNIPQLSMSFGSSNPVWGETKNPFSAERGPGGSSSGEGALIGYRGSLFGIGNDIGGSVRVPASFCGIVCLKATPKRFVNNSLFTEGIVGVPAIPGILARDVDTLILIHRLLWENGFLNSFEPLAVPLLWQHQLLNETRKLRIGFYDQGEKFPTTPGVKRCIRICRQVLEKHGHVLIPYCPPHLDENTLTCLSLFHADQLKSYVRMFKYEDLDSSMSQHFYGKWVPFCLRPFVAPFISMYSQILADYFKIAQGRTTRHSYQLWNELIKKRNYVELVLQQWKDLNLDLCIGPTFICPPPRLKDIDHFMVLEGYTATYNYLEFPAGVVPVTKENETDQELLKEYPTSDTMLHLVKETTKGAIGMPIGVQVIGRPYQDELVLRGMKVLSECLNEEVDSY